MFYAKAIMPRRDDISLVQDVAEEVAVIDFVDQRGVEIGGQRLEPGRVVTAQRAIERDDPRGLARMDRPIAHRSAREPETVGERFALHARGAVEKYVPFAAARAKQDQISTGEAKRREGREELL